MKKAVNVTTAIALALAASVTYNIVQHQRAKGIRPGSQKQEDSQPQSEQTISPEASPAAGSAVTAAKPASAKSASAAQISSITFRSASYDKYDDELNIYFTSPSSLQNSLSKKAIEFTPAVANYSLYTSGSSITVNGDFKHGVKYRVRVKKGLMDRNGKASLENDAVFDVTIPDLTEKLSFLTNGSVFPLSNTRIEFPYSSRNIKKLTAKVYRAFNNNLGIMYANSNTYTMEFVGEKTFTLSDPSNEMVNHMLDISDILCPPAPDSSRKQHFQQGYYVLELEYDRKSDWGDYSYRESERRDFMLTDFAMVAATASDPMGGIPVFVRRISDGTPVADAEVELTTSKNQLIEKAKTDSTGKAMFKVSSPYFLTNDRGKGELYSVSIRKGDEFAWFPLDLHVAAGDERYKAFVFTERGIVRPGESFLAASFIRVRPMEDDSSNDSKAPGHMPAAISGGPGNTPVTLAVFSPDGNQIFSCTAPADEQGFLSQMVRIPDTAPSGYYTVKIGRNELMQDVWGQTGIRVGAYVPDRVKAKLEHAPLPGGFAGAVAMAEPIQTILSADYYFGTPVPSASCRIVLSCSSNGKHPDHWKDWTVGDSSRFNFDDFSASGSIENGKAAFSLPSFGSRGMSFDPVRVNLFADVQEPGGRSVSGTDCFTLYPTGWFIGLKSKEGTGKQCVLDVALLTPEKGAKAELDEGRDITFTVYRRSWDYVLVQHYGEYRRRWQETVSEVEGAAKTFTIPQDADLSAFASQVAFDLPSGCYDIVAEYGSGIRTKINVWHSAGESGRRTGDPSELVFKTDAKTYTPGQTAKLTFTSPVDGEAFVVKAGLRLDNAEAVSVKAGENTIEAKIPEGCLNGTYHVALILVGKQDGEYIRSSGNAELVVDHSAAHKLNVDITVPGIVRPETEADVTISLATPAGEKKGAQVCLFAVDEGVLALTGFKTPDIFKFFCQSDDSFISMSESYSKFFPNLKLSPDGAIGGGDDAGAALAASLVKMKDAVRIIEPVVKIPESGSATLKVKIPDHSGALRFMAVASGADAVGSGEREVIVRSPVGLTVSAPRVLAPGDEAVITVRAFNHDARDGAVKFTLALPDTLQILGGEPRIDALKAGETKDVSFRVKTTDELGEGTIAATLSVGAETRTETVYLTVRQPNPPQTVTKFVTVAPGKDFTLDLPAEFISVKNASLSVSSSPAIGVKDALEWLNEYPYGCLEQTVSGAFPFVAAQSLVKSGLLDAEIAKTMQPKIPAAYARILNMLAGDGAFSMWPDVRREWPEGTVYAAHFIFEAQAAKLISVDNTIKNSVTAYLLRLANSAGTYSPELRAYAVYVLAAAGNKDFVIPARNILAGSRPGFAQFLASAALIRGGYAGEGAETLRQSLSDTSWLYGKSPAVGMNDTASRAGMVLDVLMKCDPKGSRDAAARLATFLAGRIRQDGNCWGTTQSNAWASMGLAAFAEYYPPAELAGTFAAPEKEKQSIAGKTFAQAGLDASGKTVIGNSGDSDFFVHAVVKGVPKNAQSATGPIKLNRQIFDEKGHPVTSLKHGELAFVRITVDAPDVVEDLVVSDILPAGLEIEDEVLATRMDFSGRIPKNLKIDKRHCFDRTEKRDDRFLAFGTLYHSAYAIYTVRAVTPGKFIIPALHAEAMYDPDMNGTFIPSAGQDVFEVK